MSPGSSLYLYVIIIFSIALILGIIYIFLVNRRISKFKNNDSAKKLIIEDEYVEMHIGDVKIKLNTSGNSYTEIWALKIPVSMRSSLKRCYEACAEKGGHIF